MYKSETKLSEFLENIEDMATASGYRVLQCIWMDIY